MLFHVTYRPKPNYTHEEQKAGIQLWKEFKTPEGSEIKSWHVSPNGTGFALLESPSVECIFETVAPWATVHFDYEIVPVLDAETAIQLYDKAIEYRESV